ncbi:SDR family NAD(P)-dependent oxidoreductase [Halosegnis rubeus]|uniref:SDR family NAD(P)-dependent oxidoreductase n=1 Tax=Halosegnis rubeus TaxID=2212850 RepID=A0A5N5UDI0_9EURY|nr:SDR family oxidoreductase [Halosegnis rubeus]KAB7513042.1 SDR family NAD(P)-dependent oxidoreductase [Halosegnis rubeus]KAB7516590.1 SDR family NAD(P)-dependent oxidoreductase [Halosegnis rubeus]
MSEVVLVTGASSGIGAATARRLAADGYRVVLAARSEGRLDRVREDLPTDALAVPTDVTDLDAVAGLVDATLDRFGRLDGVVVNAGTGEQPDVPLSELSLDQFEQVTDVNVKGAFYTVRAALPAIRERSGAVVFLGSYKGKYPSTATPIYAASKWWLRGFAASLAGRVGPEGVQVGVVNPSGVPTAFGGEFREQSNDDRLDPDAELSIEDVADAVAYVLSNASPAAVTELDLFREDIYERF